MEPDQAVCGFGTMSNPLQDKDRHWRRRPNGATPVFDPGLSALGTDDEAGGAVAPPPSDGASDIGPPLPATPRDRGRGLRLTPGFWYSCVAVVVLVLVIAAGFSLD